MPTKNPRVNVVLEKPLYDLVSSWARRDGLSLSLKVRDVVKAAVNAEEDAVLTQLAETRERTFSRRKALTHTQVWGHLTRKRR
jgi:hypothetical protein